jgi:4-amino-4-deoxy-L-arabinose transferase-like glycosyltransferase
MFSSRKAQDIGEFRTNEAIAFRDAATLLVILLTAAVFRLEDVTQPLVDAFSWREASTAMIADNFLMRSWNIFFPEVSWTGPGPSYQGREFQTVTYITALLYALFGWHDWIGRLVAIAFGLWGVFAFHRLLDRTWGLLHAHAGALMLAIMPGAVFIDRSFLPDPAMLALITTGCWLYIAFLQDEKPSQLVAAIVITTIGIIAKLPGIIVLLPLTYATFQILHRRGALTTAKIVRLGLIASLVVIAVFAYYRWALYLGSSYPPYHVAGSGYLWEDGLAKLVRERFYLERSWLMASEWFLTLPVIALFILGLLAGPPDEEPGAPPQAPWLFHIWLAAAVVLYLAAAREMTSNPWNFHVVNLPVAALAGRGLLLVAAISADRVPRWMYWLRVTVVVGVVAWISNASIEENLKPAYAEAGYDLGRRLNLLSREGDLVIAVAPTVGDPVAIYYSRRRGWVFPPGGGKRDWSILLDDTQQAIEELESLRAQGADWFGVTKNARDSKHRFFVEHHRNLISHLDRTAEKVVDDEMLIYRLRNAETAAPN